MRFCESVAESELSYDWVVYIKLVCILGFPHNRCPPLIEIHIWCVYKETQNKSWISLSQVDTGAIVINGKCHFHRFILINQVLYQIHNCTHRWRPLCLWTPLTDCGISNIFISDDGSSTTLTSPNYPGLYPNRVSCRWIITSPYNTRIFAEFTNFDLEEKRDFVFLGYSQVFKELGSDSGINSPYYLTGEVLPSNFLSPGNVFYVAMTSDYKTGLQGFVLKFQVYSELSSKLRIVKQTKKRTSSNFVENQPMDRKRNFLKNFVLNFVGNHAISSFNPMLVISVRNYIFCATISK